MQRAHSVLVYVSSLFCPPPATIIEESHVFARLFRLPRNPWPRRGWLALGRGLGVASRPDAGRRSVRAAPEARETPRRHPPAVSCSSRFCRRPLARVHSLSGAGVDDCREVPTIVVMLCRAVGWERSAEAAGALEAQLRREPTTADLRRALEDVVMPEKATRVVQTRCIPVLARAGVANMMDAALRRVFVSVSAQWRVTAPACFFPILGHVAMHARSRL